MKQKRLKNYLKIGILLFGISVLLYACQKDSLNDSQETEGEKEIKRISLNELNAKIGNSDSYNKLRTLFDINQSNNNQNFHQRLSTDDNPYLLTDEIIMIEKDSISFYTFRIQSNICSSTFYNFVLAIDALNTIHSARILEYIPSNNWLQNTTQPFIGQVKAYDNDLFNLTNISQLFAARFTQPCVTGVTTRWECNEGNNHSPQQVAANPDDYTCHSWEYIVKLKWGQCVGGITQEPNYIGQTPESGNGGGGGANTSGGTNDNDSVLDETSTTVLTPPNRDDEDDDCDTSKEDLKKVFPNMSDTDASTLAHVINEKGKDFGIDTKEKLQHFLAQAGHEVGEFANGIGIQESLYYTTASRLKKIFKPYFKQNAADTLGTKRDADSTYLQNSSKVANYVYCCRMGNGNEASGDGYKYRGRGIFQLTGKTNYTNFKTWYNNKYDPDKDFLASPDQVKSNDTIAILSALWYYKTNVLDKITVDSTTTSLAVTKKVNGGTNGKKHRKEIFEKAKDSIDCQ